MNRRQPLAAVAALAAALVMTACAPSRAPRTAGATPTGTPATSAPAATPTATAAANGACSDGAGPEASFAPDHPLGAPGDVSAWPSVAAIQKRHSLQVGVASDILQLGARNPLTGAIEGFDIDMLHAIAKAIFNDPNRITFKVITAAQRPTSLQSDVDIVARAYTINCDRWTQIDFSSVYFLAGQKVLVPLKASGAGLVPSYTGIADLARAKKRVCATTGSTSIARLKNYPGVIPVGVSVSTDCLVQFQEGKVDAITGDDAILAGLAAQDPYAKVVGAAFSREPYGLGIAKSHPDLVRFVNAVLQQVRSDGRWEASYTKWLYAPLGRVKASPPAPTYGRAR